MSNFEKNKTILEREENTKKILENERVRIANFLTAWYCYIFINSMQAMRKRLQKKRIVRKKKRKVLFQYENYCLQLYESFQPLEKKDASKNEMHMIHLPPKVKAKSSMFKRLS